MIKLVKKRVLGSSKIPKFDAYPPMVICETEDYFTMLKNCGFIVQDVEEEKSVEKVIDKKPKAKVVEVADEFKEQVGELIKEKDEKPFIEEPAEEEKNDEQTSEETVTEEVDEKNKKPRVQGIRKTSSTKKSK